MGGMTNILLAAALALGASPAGNRAAIQGEIDAVAAKGGGRVTIPAGEWLTGSLELKSGVELHLEKDAVLKGSVDPKDYNANDVFPENFHSDAEEWSGGHLVYAYRAKNVAVTGEGVIDGNGGAFFTAEPEEDSRFPWYKYGLKLHTLDRTWYRPGPMLAFFLSQGIRIEGVTLRNTPAWTCHIRCCEGVEIRNATIDADRTIANSDGFSIDCTRNVKVSGCTIRTGDDGFAIRASCRHHAATNLCENIEISDCEVSSCCFGIRFGIGTGTIRRVSVRNCRFLESALGIGFTPAWVNTGRNCYIEDIDVRDSFIGNTDRAVEMCDFPGDCRVRNVTFSNCRFEAMNPSRASGSDAAKPESVLFENCSLKFLETIAPRGHLDWINGTKRRRDRVFITLGKNTEGVTVKGCTPVDWRTRGVLLLSFDDRNFKGWEKAIPLFDRYGAHATFFISGEFDARAVQCAKKLVEHGHSVGLHGLCHADADSAIAAKGAARYYEDDIAKPRRQADVAYIPITSFAYPNCRRTEEADRLFYSKGYGRVRGGVKDATPYDPKGEKQKDRKPLVTNEDVYFPVADLPKHRLINTIIMGEAYHTDINEICDCLRRVAKNREVMSITSHDIGPDAKFIHMKTEWLETMLKLARELDIQVLGFDELPPPDGPHI